MKCYYYFMMIMDSSIGQSIFDEGMIAFVTLFLHVSIECLVTMFKIILVVDFKQLFG